MVVFGKQFQDFYKANEKFQVFKRCEDFSFFIVGCGRAGREVVFNRIGKYILYFQNKLD